ncbi:hypothetical protein V495_08479 [Pseudogymnoascus sp. VKM F-4514 (FW-929)]|nr:hypothetical protein V490_03479 [Pseudogymnoascus sp. VKM F-3557]KFY33054.1 hypothetical protein V495_08479 [Pseudogymnoascus sp. VKM F-4514 (FW-929)]KFY55120.1 hypothetical protein V497_07176 [Pseudogymnoascus sp. VKM F-4516 (FW-969)]
MANTPKPLPPKIAVDLMSYKPQGYHRLANVMSRDNNDLLLQVSALNNIIKANKSQQAVLKEWLQDAKGGDCFQKGAEARLWEGDDTSEFLTLHKQSEETDFFTKWITLLIVGIFHRFWGEKHKLGKVVDEESGLVSYDDSKINTASTIFATVLSSTLPVITILVLYVVKNTEKRIYITLGFTVAFAAILAICSSAKRVEIFAATATFAAVEVVFIGSAIPLEQSSALGAT